MGNSTVGLEASFMLCIFCKESSAGSRSVEHVIPESLGNTEVILKPGIVCDRCNNYLARKVEAPFVSLPQVQHLRFQHLIANKKGRINPVDAIATAGGGLPVQVTRYLGGPIVGDIVTQDPGFVRKFSNDRRRELIFGNDSQLVDSRIASRFVAKIALEYLAYAEVQRYQSYTWPLEPEFDDLRNYARWNNGDDWPLSVRRIHRDGALWHEPDGSVTQPGWMASLEPFEAQRLPDGALRGIFYFICSFLGYEFAIGIAGRSIKHYREWVWRHPRESRLFDRRPGHLIDGSGFATSHTPRGVMRVIYQAPKSP